MRLVIPSVDYADHLRVSLSAWLRLVDRACITVVTAARDHATQDVAGWHGVRVLVTDAWTRHDPTFTGDTTHWHHYWRSRGERIDRYEFNKALALDEAFGFAGTKTAAPADGEICISADADCEPVGTLPSMATIAPHVIYGCRRFTRHADGSKGPEEVIRGRALRCQHRAFTCVMEGYLQLFRYRPGLRFGSYPGADAYDSDFAEFHFTEPGREIPGLYVLHAGLTHTHWRGRVAERVS